MEVAIIQEYLRLKKLLKEGFVPDKKLTHFCTELFSNKGMPCKGDIVLNSELSWKAYKYFHGTNNKEISATISNLITQKKTTIFWTLIENFLEESNDKEFNFNWTTLLGSLERATRSYNNFLVLDNLQYLIEYEGNEFIKNVLKEVDLKDKESLDSSLIDALSNEIKRRGIKDARIELSLVNIKHLYLHQRMSEVWATLSIIHPDYKYDAINHKVFILFDTCLVDYSTFTVNDSLLNLSKVPGVHLGASRETVQEITNTSTKNSPAKSKIFQQRQGVSLEVSPIVDALLKEGGDLLMSSIEGHESFKNLRTIAFEDNDLNVASLEIKRMANTILDLMYNHIEGKKNSAKAVAGYQAALDRIVHIKTLPFTGSTTLVHIIDQIKRDFDRKKVIPVFTQFMSQHNLSFQSDRKDFEQYIKGLFDRVTPEDILRFEDNYNSKATQIDGEKEVAESEINAYYHGIFDHFVADEARNVFDQAMKENTGIDIKPSSFCLQELPAGITDFIEKKLGLGALPSRDNTYLSRCYTKNTNPSFTTLSLKDDSLEDRRAKFLTTLREKWSVKWTNMHLRMQVYNKSQLDLGKEDVLSSLKGGLKGHTNYDLRGLRSHLGNRSPDLIEISKEESMMTLQARGVKDIDKNKIEQRLKTASQRRDAFQVKFQSFINGMKFEVNGMKLNVAGMEGNDFDANDFLMLYSACKRGLPLVTVNTKIMKQWLDFFGPAFALLSIDSGGPKIIHPNQFLTDYHSHREVSKFLETKFRVSADDISEYIYSKAVDDYSDFMTKHLTQGLDETISEVAKTSIQTLGRYLVHHSIIENTTCTDVTSLSKVLTTKVKDASHKFEVINMISDIMQSKGILTECRRLAKISKKVEISPKSPVCLSPTRKKTPTECPGSDGRKGAKLLFTPPSSPSKRQPLSDPRNKKAKDDELYPYNFPVNVNKKLFAFSDESGVLHPRTFPLDEGKILVR
ncbi:MAG TPA: hypothetical protein QF353_03015 [Gammaproteobacteria bacterium]|nr:hypothetical protein [Gammaproteobacteria bacterium]